MSEVELLGGKKLAAGTLSPLHLIAVEAREEIIGAVVANGVFPIIGKSCCRA